MPKPKKTVKKPSKKKDHVKLVDLMPPKRSSATEDGPLNVIMLIQKPNGELLVRRTTRSDVHSIQHD
jgi:hypothetical protein